MNTCQTAVASPWADAAVISTALGALVFVGAYAWTTRGAWRHTPMGRHVMTFMASILLVSVMAVVAVVWGTDWPYRAAIRTAAWGLIAGCIWWRVVILFRVQHRRDT